MRPSRGGCGAAARARVLSGPRARCAGDVVSVGDKTSALKAGDTVVYSKFGIGVTDLEIKGEEYAVLKEEDIIGTFPKSGAPASAARARARRRAQPPPGVR